MFSSQGVEFAHSQIRQHAYGASEETTSRQLGGQVRHAYLGSCDRSSARVVSEKLLVIP